MDPIKEAFARAKQDISDLKSQLESLSKDIEEIKRILQQTNKPTNQQTDPVSTSSFQHINPTENLNELSSLPLQAVKTPISYVSTGNRGVPTDRQTNQQTDRQTHSPQQIPSLADFNSHQSSYIDNIERVSQVLESLDSIKKDLRHQFKRLTNQEMLVFSTIYQLEEEGFIVDYPLLATKLNLSESSIRDYTLKIIRKGIPLQKLKENHKKIILSIPQDLKKMATLPTILSLREI